VRYERQRQLKEQWEQMSLEEALKTLADMRADLQTGALIVEARLSAQNKDKMICCVCNKEILGNPTSYDSVHDHETGLKYNKFYCSQECLARKIQAQTGILSLAKT
jgi:hypothetical protein